MDSEVAVKIPDPPPDYQLDLVVGAIRPLRRLTSPKFYGIENIPDRGALLVGNHTIFGLLDVPFMIAELWKRRAIKVRALGEHAHYKVPIWRNLLETGGMVRGTRANCGELMRRGENVLVFPGGAREVNKKRGQKYQLLWENRMGFARMAIDHRYPIIPFAAVGAEEMLDVVVDSDTPVYRQVTDAIGRATGWPTLPMVRGIGLTPIPRPERLYFWFGKPISTAGFGGLDRGDRGAGKVRDEVKHRIEDGIEFLQSERERDPHRGLGSRLLGRAKPQA